MLTPRRWIVPLDASKPDGPAIVVEPTDDHRIQMYRRGIDNTAGWPEIEPMTAAQLGQALQDASACVAQQRAKRTR